MFKNKASRLTRPHELVIRLLREGRAGVGSAGVSSPSEVRAVGRITYGHLDRRGPRDFGVRGLPFPVTWDGPQVGGLYS